MSCQELPTLPASTVMAGTRLKGGCPLSVETQMTQMSQWEAAKPVVLAMVHESMIILPSRK